MKKVLSLQKLALNKRAIAHLSIRQQQMVRGGKRFTDPATENPCDPTPSMLYCSLKSRCC